MGASRPTKHGPCGHCGDAWRKRCLPHRIALIAKLTPSKARRRVSRGEDTARKVRRKGMPYGTGPWSCSAFAYWNTPCEGLARDLPPLPSLAALAKTLAVLTFGRADVHRTARIQVDRDAAMRGVGRDQGLNQVPVAIVLVEDVEKHGVIARDANSTARRHSEFDAVAVNHR